MINKEFKTLLKNKGLIITMAIVLLVPILYAGTFLKSVWNPYDNTGNMKVGVVNLDKKVDFEGKTLEVGNSMVNKLKENKKVNWQFVDKETAEKQLREGDYYVVVTIPENFSKNATTLSSENPEKMNIDFTTNFTKSKNGEKIMETVASNLTKTVKDQVVKTYSTTLYSKFSEIGGSLQKAADASSTLNNGLSRISAGGEKLGSGINQLSNGSKRLATGLTTLNDAGAKLGDGISQLQSGSETLSNGLSSLNDKKTTLSAGINELTTGSNTLTAGFDAFKTKSVMLASGVDTLYNGSKEFQAGLLKYTNGVLTLNEKLLAKKDDLNKINAGGATLNNGMETLVDGILKINSKLLDKQDDLNRLIAGGTVLENGVTSLSEKAPKLYEGASKINAGLDTLNSSLPSDRDLSSKKSKLNSTIDQLKGLKLTYRTNFNPLSSAFTELGTQIESIKELISKIDSQVTPAATQSSNNFTNLKQQLDATNLTETQKASILAAAQSDVSAASPQPSATTQSNNQIKTDLTTAINSVSSKYSSMKYRVGKLQYIKNQLDKFDVNNLATDLDGTISGFSTIKNAVGKLAAGSGELKAGLSIMNDKTPTLVAGFNQYKGGVDQTITSLTTGELANGVNKLATETPKLKAGLTNFTDGVNLLTTSMSTGELAQGVGALATKSSELQNGFDKLTGGINLLHGKLPELTTGINALVNGNAKINAGLNKLQAKIPELSIGIQKLDDGGKKLYQNLTVMKSKAPELLAGMSTAKTGAVSLSTALAQMQAKAPELLEGLNKAKDGSGLLADKLSSGADKVASAKTGDKNSDMLANPIKTNTHDIAEETSYGNAMAPFFLVFGLLIAAAAFNILFPARKREAGESVAGLFSSRLVAMSTFAIFAVIIEVIAMKLFFDFRIEYFGMYFFGLIISAIVFMIITHFLSYTFGKVGNGLSIGFVALQFVLTTPLFPKEMLPTLYSGLIPFTPVYYGDVAVRHAVLGGLTGEIYTNAILILAALGIIFLVLTYISYNRANKTITNLAK